MNKDVSISIRKRVPHTPLIITSTSIKPQAKHYSSNKSIIKTKCNLINLNQSVNSKSYQHRQTALQSYQQDINHQQVNTKNRYTTSFKDRIMKFINIQSTDITLPFNNKKKNVPFRDSKTTSSFYPQNSKQPVQRSYSRSKISTKNQIHNILYNHYLKIKKMNPKLYQQRILDIRQLTPENACYLSQKVQNIMLKHQQKYNLINIINKPFKGRTNTLQILQNNHQNQTNDNLLQEKVESIDQIKKNIKIIAENDNNQKREYFIFGKEFHNKYNSNQQSNNLNLKLYHYRDFLFKVNFTNGLYVKFKTDIDKPYLFYVGKGNNSELLKGILKRRFWWKVIEKQSQVDYNHVNMVWTQLKLGKLLEKLNKSQVYQKYEKQQKLISHESTKEKDEDNQKIMNGQDLLIWKSYYSKHKQIQDKFTDKVYYKRLNHFLSKKQIQYIDDSSAVKVHNHFECNEYIGNKKALFYYLTRYYKAINIDPFQNIPITFHITNGINDEAYQNFYTKYEEFQQIRKQSDLKNIWIIKPGQSTNRGNGITVCSNLDQIKIRLKSKEKNLTSGHLRTFIIQKYIEKPLLYKKRKFDIRHYMLMTCFNGKFKGYWFQEGYLRTSSTQYSIKNTKDLYTHLTNDAIQKHNCQYGKYQKGNKLSYAQFQSYMQSLQKDKSNTKYSSYNFYNHTLPQMKKLALDSIRATYQRLNPQRKTQTFQLFGLDFMIDQNLKVYLIQVNTNPCLQTTCPILLKIISSLIQNLYKICIDSFFPPPLNWQNSKKYTLGTNSMKDNKFELIFDENTEGEYLQELLKNKEINDIGDIKEDENQYQDEGNQWAQDI